MISIWVQFEMVLSMERWVGKVAIVTGASSGIGAALVEKLVEEGLQVVGLARRLELLEQHVQKLSKKKGKLYPLKADLTKEEDILQAFKWAVDNLGPVHILVNNAGVYKPGGITSGKTENFRAVLEVNVLATAVAAREAIRIMQANNIDGHIVNINSIVGHMVPNFPHQNMYPASKHAITALTETLRIELNFLKTKIRITSVSPGLVETEMTTLGNNVPERRRQILSQMPSLKAEDVADAVVYALSTPSHVQVHEMIIKPIGESV